MKSTRPLLLCASTALLLAGCASTPMGPTVRAMPPQGKPFEQFAMEQSFCKQYAGDQVRGQAESANTTGIVEGLAGTALGAGLGAAVGGGEGAAIGAAAGAVAGTAVGGSTSSHEQKSIQRQYNDAYLQCMASKGNNVPQPAQIVVPQTTVIYTQPQQPTVVYAPPPPTVVYTQAPPPPHHDEW